MLEYVIFRIKRAILQFLCGFIPFSATRKKVRKAIFKQCLGDKIITIDKVDSHLPSAVLARINAQKNEYFIAKNRQINAILGGGGSTLKAPIKRHILAILTSILNLKIPNPH